MARRANVLRPVHVDSHSGRDRVVVVMKLRWWDYFVFTLFAIGMWLWWARVEGVI